MSKIHLEIEIPGNAKTYEFVLDDRMKIGTAKEQIKKQIAELEGHDLFAGLDNIVFGSLELEGLIQDNETFREVGIKNAAGWSWYKNVQWLQRMYSWKLNCKNRCGKEFGSTSTGTGGEHGRK